MLEKQFALPTQYSRRHQSRLRCQRFVYQGVTGRRFRGFTAAASLKRRRRRRVGRNRDGEFRGFTAAASLKRRPAAVGVGRGREFRGFTAAASLKQPDMIGHIQDHGGFRGFTAAASLKLGEGVTMRNDFDIPRLHRRGLIEAPRGPD